MASVRFFLLAALLVVLAVAAPTPAKKRGLQKRTFKVPRHLNTAHPRGLNGFDAIKKVALKYNIKQLQDGFIGIEKGEATPRLPKINSSETTNSTGTVPAVPEENASLFLSPVDIGGQTFNMDFDTGSSDLWVFSTALSKQDVGQHSVFDPAKSATFQKVDGAQWQISYGDGSGAAGTVGTDTVTIGGVQVENQVVEVANKVSTSFVEDTNTDGLVGLAFSKLNTVNDGVKKTPQKTFFDNVINDLDQPVFTADLDPQGAGVYEFGRIDTTKFEGDMAWIPVNASSGFWQFESSRFAVGNQEFKNRAASKAIADTGTSLLLVDQPVAEAYYSAVEGAELNEEVSGFIYPCSSKLPDFALGIGDSYMAVVPGDQITFATVDAANTTCFGGIQGNRGAGMQIYGDTLFKSQFVAFNGGNQSLGFAAKPRAA